MNRYERWWFMFWLRRRRQWANNRQPHRLRPIDRVIGWPIYLTVWVLNSRTTTPPLEGGFSLEEK